MFKFFKRLARLFSIKSTKAIKKYEDAIEVYEYELQRSRENLQKIADSQSKVNASMQTAKDKKQKTMNYIQSLKRILDRAIEQNDDALGEETIVLLESNEKKAEQLDVNIASYESVIKQLDEQYTVLKEKLHENINKLDGLKAQNEFAKNMETINKELKNQFSDGLDAGTFEKIEEELQEKIYFEKDRNTRLTPEASFEERANKETRKSKFEKYKEQKLAESTDKKVVSLDSEAK